MQTKLVILFLSDRELNRVVYPPVSLRVQMDAVSLKHYIVTKVTVAVSSA